jgi:hypothetical protein
MAGTSPAMTGPEGIVTVLLTSVTLSVTFRCESSSPGRTPSGGKPGGRGECGARGRICSPLPGGFGHHVRRHYDRCARCFAGCGGGVGGKPQRLAPLPTKPGLKLSLGDDDSLWQEPWWNAGRRARPTAEGRRKPPYPWRAVVPAGTASVTPASAGVPLPSFMCRKRVEKRFFPSSLPG